MFANSLAFRPGAGKREANDSSGDEAATTKNQKEAQLGPGVFDDPTASNLSVTQMRAERTADL